MTILLGASAVFLFFFGLILYTVLTSPIEQFSLMAPALLDEPSPLTKFMEFPSGKIWTYDSIDESPEHTEPIFFIHSMGASLYCWRYQLPAFKTEQRVLAMDLLGHGLSAKNIRADYGLDAQTERLMAFLKAKNITRCKLVGCSMGGAFALWLSYLHPEMFTKVAVIAPASFHRLVPLPRVDLSLLAPLARLMISRDFIKFNIERSVTNTAAMDAKALDHYFEPYKDPATIACFLKCSHALKDPRIYRSLKERTTPTLILWGAKDVVIREREFKQIQKQSSTAISHVHPTGGHHLMEDEPEWVNKKIKEFFGPTIV